MDVFNENMTLDEAKKQLVNHLNEVSYQSIENGKICFEVASNGDASWYFDELVELILKKTARADIDIVKIALDKKINLFDIKTPKIPTSTT